MECSIPGLLIHHHLPAFTQAHIRWVSDAIQPFHPLSSPAPPAFSLSQHQGLSNGSVLRIRWPKYWSFSISISPSNKCSGLISFRMDWLDLLAVQGTLKSKSSPTPQFKSINSLVISFLYGPTLTSVMTTGKTIALTRQTFVSKVMSLLFNMLSRFFIAFLPRSKRLLVSWLQSPSAVILEPPKIKSVTASIASPSICYEVMGLDAMIFVFLNVEFQARGSSQTWN